MSLVPAVTELLLAELLYLQYDNPTQPIYMYINSTGVTVRGGGGGVSVLGVAARHCRGWHCQSAPDRFVRQAKACR